MPFAIINFLYTRPCDSRARTRALMVEFLSIADSLRRGVKGKSFRAVIFKFYFEKKIGHDALEVGDA